MPLVGMLLIFIFFLTLHTTYASPSCYYPSGDHASTDVPCSQSGDSVCCGQGFICLSNGVCQNPLLISNEPGLYSRGSCTDQTWNSSQCPRFCVNPNAPFNDVQTSGQELLKCPGRDNLFYCNDSNALDANCTTGDNILSFSATPTPVTTVSFLSAASTTTITPSATPDPTSTPPPNATTSRAAIIGASVGGSVFVLLLTIGLLIFFKRRNKMELEEVYKGPPRSFMEPPGSLISSAAGRAPKIVNEAEWPLERGSGQGLNLDLNLDLDLGGSRGGGRGDEGIELMGVRGEGRSVGSSGVGVEEMPRRPSRPDLRDSETRFISGRVSDLGMLGPVERDRWL